MESLKQNFCKICGQPILREWRAVSTLRLLNSKRATPFEKLKYCSRECWKKRSSISKRVNPSLFKKCQQCGEEFKAKGGSFGLFCSRECYVESKKKQVEERNQEILRRIFQDKSLEAFYISNCEDISRRAKEVYKTYLLKKNNFKCEICGILNKWNEKPLTFILDHIDGNFQNNSISNLRLVCPNCNSQLPTTGSRNNGKGRGYQRKRMERLYRYQERTKNYTL